MVPPHLHCWRVAKHTLLLSLLPTVEVRYYLIVNNIIFKFSFTPTGILFGTLLMELCGDVSITCNATQCKAEIEFKGKVCINEITISLR